MNDSVSLYSDIEVSTEVMGVSRHRLIQMLLQKCLEQMKVAEFAIEANNILNKCNALKHALDILLHLRSCLNFKDAKTREMAKILNDAYQAIERNLLNANLQNSKESLQAAYNALSSIKSGWDGIADEN